MKIPLEIKPPLQEDPVVIPFASFHFDYYNLIHKIQ